MLGARGPALPSAAVLLWLVLACSAAPKPSPSSRAPLLSEAAAPAVPQAQWRYHPRHAERLLAVHELDQQRALYTSKRGERWLVDRGNKSAQAATTLAPEALLATLPRGPNRWAFVGASGKVYQASTPLGVFESTADPPTPLLEVSASPAALLGVGREGQLWRSGDAGASWREMGPADARFSDVALASNGHGLALAVPEALWYSADHGQTWAALPSAPLGLLELGSHQALLLGGGVLDRYLWDDRAPGHGRFVPANAEQLPKLTLPFPPPRGPNARALLAREAVIMGERYIEVARGGLDGNRRVRPWQLWSGSLHGPLLAQELKQLDGCLHVKIAGFARWLYLACAPATGAKNKPTALDFFQSQDEGAHWRRLSRPLWGSLDSLQLAVGDDGVLLVSGACEVNAKDCSGAGILRGEVDAKGETSWRPGVMPSLMGVADALLFSHDGRMAYAFGRRTKSDVLGMFVSRDGGKFFDPHDIDGVPIRHNQALGLLAATAAADASMSLVFTSLPGTDARLAVVDEQGNLLALAAPPKDRVSIAAHGLRALAVDRNGDAVWESSNGGTSWARVDKLPAVVCVPSASGRNECTVDVSCHEAGCVLSDSLTRLGWSGDGLGSASEPEIEEAPPPAPEPYGTALGCQLASGPWRRMGLVQRPPTAEQAALGGYAWFALGESPIDAEVVLWRARSEAPRTVERRTLLQPVNDPLRVAYLASLQVEGAAALRYRVPNKVAGAIGQVELAWEDLIHGHSRRTQLSVTSGHRHDDVESSKGAAQRAQVDLLSITHGGLYLRVHASAFAEQDTYFLDGNQVTRLPAVSWPTSVPALRAEWLHVGNQHAPVVFFGSAALVRATREQHAWSFSAQSLGWMEPEHFGVEQALGLTYWQGRPAVHVSWIDPTSTKGWASVLPFAEQGSLLEPALMVPTQGDLGATPVPCAANDRRASPRVVAEAQLGTRHPLLVNDGTAVHALVTGAAVLHGTPKTPCVASYDAALLDVKARENSSAMWALVDPAALEQAWLFRAASAADESQPEVEYQTMACRFDVNLELPKP